MACYTIPHTRRLQADPDDERGHGGADDESEDGDDDLIDATEA
jgi:hypothetical protein